MLLGIGFLCLAMVLFSMLDASAKYGSAAVLPVEQIMLHAAISAARSSLLLLFNKWTDGTRWVTKRPWLQIVRAFCLAGSTACNFTGVRYLSAGRIGHGRFRRAAADRGAGRSAARRAHRRAALGARSCSASSASSSSPRPIRARFNLYILWPVGGMVFYAFYALTTRVLARSDIASPGTMVVFSNIVAVLLFAPFFTHGWVTPPDTLTLASCSPALACSAPSAISSPRAPTPSRRRRSSRRSAIRNCCGWP